MYGDFLSWGGILEKTKNFFVRALRGQGGGLLKTTPQIFPRTLRVLGWLSLRGCLEINHYFQRTKFHKKFYLQVRTNKI